MLKKVGLISNGMEKQRRFAIYHLRFAIQDPFFSILSASWHPPLMRRSRMYDHARLFARLLQASASDPSASLRVMSRSLGVHPHTLTQVVRERTGSSFSAWRARRRVSESCRMLRTRPELSIKEIAAASGFSATSVFDRFLRRTCGRSPSECRSSCLEDTPVSETLCAERREPLRRSARLPGAKVNVLASASTIDGVHPAAADATLEVGRRVIPTETSRSPDVISARRASSRRNDVERAGEASGGRMRHGAGDRGAITQSRCPLSTRTAGSLEPVHRRRHDPAQRRASWHRRNGQPHAANDVSLGAGTVRRRLEDHDGGEGEWAGSVRDADRGVAGGRAGRRPH